MSLAVCKAGAAEKGVPLYRHIADLAGHKDVILPVPVSRTSFVRGLRKWQKELSVSCNHVTVCLLGKWNTGVSRASASFLIFFFSSGRHLMSSMEAAMLETNWQCRSS